MTIVWILSYLALFLLGLQAREVLDRYLDWRAQRTLTKAAAKHREQYAEEGSTEPLEMDHNHKAS